MANYWIDHIQGWLSGVPAEVIAAKRDLQDLIDPKHTPHDLVGGAVAAFDKITDKTAPQQATYQRAWNIMAPQKTQKSKPHAPTMELAEMLETYDTLRNNIISTETIAFGVSNPKLFMYAAQKSTDDNVNGKAAYDAMHTVSQKIFDSNKSAYDDPALGKSGENTIARQYFGGAISMAAAHGYSRLGDVDACEKVLSKHKSTYGYPHKDFASFIDAQDKTPENNALLVAAIRVENGKDLSLETMETILKSNTFDDTVNQTLIGHVTNIANTHYIKNEYNPESGKAIRALMAYANGDYNPINYTSKSLAFQELVSGELTDAHMMSAGRYDKNQDSTIPNPSSIALKELEFDVIRNALARNNPAVMDHFLTQNSIWNFAGSYSKFQHEHKDNRTDMQLQDFLIPSNIKGDAAARSRNQLTDALIGKPKDYYHYKSINDLPDNDQTMDAAIALTMSVLSDVTVADDSPEKMQAMHTMSEIMLAQDIARKKAHNFVDDVESGNNSTSNYYQNKQDMLEEKLMSADPVLSVATDRVKTLWQHHDFTDIAQKILDRKNQQWKALFGDEPTPQLLSTRFKPQEANAL